MALVRVCLTERDLPSAETAIELMKRAWFSPPEESLNAVLGFYASRGDISNVERFIKDVLPGPPTPKQRDLHIKAHIRSSSSSPAHINTFPTTALTLLHAYEAAATPAPMQTYTRLISALFSLASAPPRPSPEGRVNPSALRAQAWDLFTHMRYVAHPTPDALLYTLMIRACAHSSSSSHAEPERALDLWTEMTVDRRIAPSAGAYAAVILALARSGRREFIAEGFRLAREMVEGRGGVGGGVGDRAGAEMRPDRRTFCALLEGAKRIGDLGRVRWILAEIVKGSGEEVGAGSSVGEREVEVDEEIMLHVFHAYAAYKPPFKRSAMKLVDEQVEGQGQDEAQSDAHRHGAPNDTDLGLDMDEDMPSFSHLPPQTHADVIAEAKLLFARIISDTSSSHHSSAPSPLHRKFARVHITPRLLNAYLSIFYAHASLDAAAALWRTLFGAYGVERNVRTYIEALERCAIARRGDSERSMARRWAEEVWAAWEGVERAGWTAPGARMVERANIAMLRVYSLTNELDTALSLLRTFVARYPPSALLPASSSPTPFSKHPMLSTRTTLAGARPLVRMSSAPAVPDDGVPPLLTFADVEVLHQRLVRRERGADVRYVGWVCRAYAGALRRRREGAMRATVVAAEGGIGVGAEEHGSDAGA
ncbi:hypothetical protein BV22DRAFT_1021614 [Leucogyrophana mollusca]|uniref:Uncharacterized protein n=1 Tax=Leucogyrophana mollusca TaxID=85980 RepID=A0ACB8B4P4_9AGAM|nr:hypothetical protein BV22DRAFT_1021614 [Leucogyrophana mollusca]